MGELVAGTIQFFSTYIFQISLVALIFLLIRGYLVSKDIRFIKRKPHLEKVVVVESFGGRSNPLKEHPLYKLGPRLCEHNKNESDGGQKNCGKLGYVSCNLTDCCGWATYKNKEEGLCVAASHLGMSHYHDNVDKLYFKNKEINM
jgi:hypothetical protein